MLPKRVVLYSRATNSVGFVAEESLHPYVILPYTHGQQKWTEVSPERVVLYPRATKKRESVTQECRATLSGDEKCGFRCRRVPFIVILPYTHGQQKWTEVSPEHVVPHSRATKKR